ncbi:MAG TPA: DinB family protein [Chloroflexota bacterium]
MGMGAAGAARKAARSFPIASASADVISASSPFAPLFFGRIFNLPPFLPATTAGLIAALDDIGKPGGILDAKDDLAAGAKALITDPTVNGNNPPNEEVKDMNPTDAAEVGEKVLRLLAVARGLESDGHYNEAKFFRAAALSEEIKATVEHPTPGAELEKALADSGHHLPADITQRIFVCRRCGQVFRGDPPGECSACHSGRLTFQEVLPIYYLEPLDVPLLLAALEASPERVRQACSGVDDQSARRGEWPLAEVMSHFLGAQHLMIGRVHRMVEEEDPELAAIPSSAVKEPGQRSFSELLEAFTRERVEEVAWLRGLGEAEWRRIGRHPEWGRITVIQQLSYLTRHEQSHWPDLEAASVVR